MSDPTAVGVTDIEKTSAWHLIRPGMLGLSLTDYTVEYRVELGCFIMQWNGRDVCMAGNLLSAQMATLAHMREMLVIGYDP